MAVPCPVFTLCKHIPQLLLERRKLVLKSAKREGDLGEEGLEPCSNLGLLATGVVLHCSLGLSCAGGEAASVVLHRNLGLEAGKDCSFGVEGLLPLEKSPKLEQILGLGLGLGLCCFSAAGNSLSRGIEVQNALLQPVPILKPFKKKTGAIFSNPFSRSQSLLLFWRRGLAFAVNFLQLRTKGKEVEVWACGYFWVYW